MFQIQCSHSLAANCLKLTVSKARCFPAEQFPRHIYLYKSKHEKACLFQVTGNIFYLSLEIVTQGSGFGYCGSSRKQISRAGNAMKMDFHIIGIQEASCSLLNLFNKLHQNSTSSFPPRIDQRTSCKVLLTQNAPLCQVFSCHFVYESEAKHCTRTQQQ